MINTVIHVGFSIKCLEAGYSRPSDVEVNDAAVFPTTNATVSMFHRAFFSSIIDKHQHMHFFTFNNILVWNVNFNVKIQ